MSQVCDLRNSNCKPCEGGVPPLTAEQATTLLQQLDGWQLNGQQLQKRYEFKNYYQTMAFVNALAWVSHRQDHHPDLEVCWGHCVVRYSTHAIGGLSENDFICAAKADALFAI
ncbi:MAG: 4a-hydroxytetrahydrobiopterin dehydratase [Chitinivorax sp.]